MPTSYLMIACPPDSLAIALYALRNHRFLKITLKDSPEINYLCFVHHSDSLMVMQFAKANGYRSHELDEVTMKDKHLRPGSFVVTGDAALATWLQV